MIGAVSSASKKLKPVRRHETERSQNARENWGRF